MAENQKNPGQAGYSIVEVLITLFIISAILLLYESALQSVALSENTKNQEIALRIAKNKLESLRGAGYDALPASGTFTDTSMSTIPSGAGSISVVDYNTKLREVDVTVTWRRKGASTDSSIVLTTLVSKIGGLK